MEVVAGQGIRGDRFFGRATRLASSVSFVAAEALEAVENDLGLAPGTLDPRQTRRNIVTRGVDLNALRHGSFGIDTGDGAVWFDAAGETSPCAWMDDRLAPGARSCAARSWRPARQPDHVRRPAAGPGAAGVRRGARPGRAGERVRRGAAPLSQPTGERVRRGGPR